MPFILKISLLTLLSTLWAFGSIGLAQQDSSADATAPTFEFRGSDRSGNPLFDIGVQEPETPSKYDPSLLIEDFTAHTLSKGEMKVGSEIEYGLTGRWDAGFDFLSTLIGAPTFHTKYLLYQSNQHSFGFGLRAAFIDRETALWGSVREHFDELEAHYYRPALSWTHQFSNRLRVHTYLAQGFGEFHARLSAEGKQKLWESKHPGGDYSTRSEASEKSDEETSSQNQEKVSEKRNNSSAQRTMQVSSISGIMADSFQMTGELTRDGGQKVLLTSRIERIAIEEIRANSFRLTAAQQWVWKSFQMRLGLGLQYLVISGRDLDRELIDEAAILPASDIKFYWRF
jgi:hypothetical protein